MSTKKLQNFFFYFEVLRQPSEYQKIVKLDWNKTSEQGHIAQKNFQPDLWDLCPSHSWRGESNSQPKKIAKKLTWWVNLIVIQSWRLQHDIRLSHQVSRVSLQSFNTYNPRNEKMSSMVQNFFSWNTKTRARTTILQASVSRYNNCQDHRIVGHKAVSPIFS